VKPRVKLAETTTPDGGLLALYVHDGTFSMNLNGQELMHSKAVASERMMGSLGLERHRPGESLRILIGGLGLGFTLQAVLESTGKGSVVDVVELLPEVILWNRKHLEDLNGRLLADTRVKVLADDVNHFIRSASDSSYDVILLDIDNGPIAMVNKMNSHLYSNSGCKAIRSALASGGRAILWSAGPDPAFANRLQQAGLKVRAVPARTHESAKRAAYTLYVAERN